MNRRIVEDYLVDKNFDIRLSRNGRWMDQKCTYDAICFVADCIIEYVRNGGEQPFEAPTIWHSNYAEDNVQAVFSKPDPNLRSTLDEYNKFFRQPMKMLAAAGILNEEGRNPIHFSVANMKMLEYIALRERNACEFLCLYIEKTLKDSGIWNIFDEFYCRQDSDSFETIKQSFEQFCYDNTPINNRPETGRIFTKVLNPISYKKKKKGAKRGRLSNGIITLGDISYNRPNWRDELAGKDKNVSRGDYARDERSEPSDAYKIRRAVKNVRYWNDQFRNSKSEILDEAGLGSKATHMHHIFPKHEYPDLAYIPENIIALTSAQHLQYAHPDGNTQRIEQSYQYKCLQAKVLSIKRNLLEAPDDSTIYSFGNLVSMLDEGLDTDFFSSLDENDFDGIMQGLDLHFPTRITSIYTNSISHN